jgi:hypothetical protein
MSKVQYGGIPPPLPRQGVKVIASQTWPRLGLIPRCCAPTQGMLAESVRDCLSYELTSLSLASL